MINRSIIFCVLSIILFTGSSWYSLTQYQELKLQAETELAFLKKPIQKEVKIVPNIDLSHLLGIEKLSKYRELEKRDLFTKFRPKSLAPIAPPKISPVAPTVEVKEIDKPEEPEEEIIEEPTINYIYRGTMVLEGEEAYFLEREEPYKTYFLKPGEKGEELSLIEVTKSGIKIEDNEGNVYDLTIKKEF